MCQDETLGWLMSSGVLPPTFVGPGFHCITWSSLERISCLHLSSGQGYSTTATPWVFWWWGQHVAAGPACVISLRREPLLHCPGSKQQPTPCTVYVSCLVLTDRGEGALVRVNHCRAGAQITSIGEVMTSCGWWQGVYSLLAWLDSEEMFVHCLTANGTESIWGTSSAWPSCSNLLCLSTAYSPTTWRIADPGQGGVFPTTGVLMSPRPSCEAGEGPYALFRATGEPELCGAFYKPELRNKLRHSSVSKQFFVSFATPKKEWRRRKGLQLF